MQTTRSVSFRAAAAVWLLAGCWGGESGEAPDNASAMIRRTIAGACEGDGGVLGRVSLTIE